MDDHINGAIAATDARTVQMQQVQATLSSGRPAVVALPSDVTDAELFEFISWLATGYRALLAQRRPTSRIVVPRV